MRVRAVLFLAIVLTALALVPAGAHLFAMPNKLGLAQADYFTVQAIYRGWALFGIVLFAALAADLALVLLSRRSRRIFRAAIVALAAECASLAIFFLWTFPANRATANWTEVPADWEALRRQWEYSHAAAAIVTFAGFCALVLAALRQGGERRDASSLAGERHPT
ncbi:DUF1772 domain-containing protein [Propylenella binzhouense]|uniref:DUF1772 domain-containing protein n=1 Tax=Propylenella binzhouense TaxID=2555902 RepID=A0A964T8H2_9HYPH|nr:DUF1772 domain-containing protein [Propylenella binzhouense]MYZ50415.1 DUF1772 domain-containing protein [Propylenella binzhouense]